MTDKEYIAYAKAVHEEIYAFSTPLIDSIAGKVLTRIRKKQAMLFPLKDEWTAYESNNIDVVDVMAMLAHKGIALDRMHKNLIPILNLYITDRFKEIEPKLHFLVKYRYIGNFSLLDEVKERLYDKLKEHYDTQRMQKLLERYPDLNEVQPIE